MRIRPRLFDGSRRGAIALSSLALILLLTASPVSARPPASPTAGHPNGFLWPKQNSLVFGDVPVAIRYVDPRGRMVQAVTFYDVYQGQTGTTRRKIGTDNSRFEPTFGPGCRPSDCVEPNVWSTLWHVPTTQPDGPAQLVARAQVCGLQRCRIIGIGQITVLVEATPPLARWRTPAHLEMLAPPDCLVPLSVKVNDDNVTGVTYSVSPLAFVPGKGLPLKDQHVDGADLSGDEDNDGTTGDNSCAPTAAASSLAWFAANGYPDIMPGDMTNKELTDAIGDLAGTDDSGTTAVDLANAISDYLDSVGLGGSFTVELTENPTPEEIADEFGRGQDVMLGFFYEGGGGHMVTVNDIADEPDKDGSTQIQIMDPLTGTYMNDVHINPDGTGTYDGNDGTFGVMVSVSPVGHPGGSTPVDVATPGSTAGVWNGTWDSSGVPSGWYLLEAQATDSTGIVLSSFQAVHLEACSSPTRS